MQDTTYFLGYTLLHTHGNTEGNSGQIILKQPSVNIFTLQLSVIHVNYSVPYSRTVALII